MPYVKRLNKNGELVTIGHIKNGVFSAKRSKTLHFYRAENGWSLDKKIFYWLRKEQGLKEIQIYDKDSGIRYVTEADTFENYGIEIHYPGHGEQIVLPLAYWETLD